MEIQVAQAKSGDRAAFDKLYRRYTASVHAVLLSRVPAHLAEELVQEVFLSAFRAIGSLENPEAFGPWLHTMARNRATDYLRKKGRRPKEEALNDVEEKQSQHQGIQEQVLHQIQNLPEAYSETLIMRLVEGMTGPEIAEATGLTHGSVRVNLTRGMELLRSRLEKEGYP